MQFIDDKRYRRIVVKAYDGHDSSKKRSKVKQIGTIDRTTFTFIPSASLEIDERQRNEINIWILTQTSQKRLEDIRLQVQQIPETIEKWARMLKEDRSLIISIDYSKASKATKLLQRTLNQVGRQHSWLPKDFVLKVVTATVVLPSVFIAY